MLADWEMKIRTASGVLVTTFVNGYVYYSITLSLALSPVGRLLIMMALFSVQVYYLPQFYQVVFGKSPIASGLLLLPLMLAQCR
jgi:hypothetical protein